MMNNNKHADVRFQEIKRRHMEGQKLEQMAEELNLPMRVVQKIHTQVMMALTLEDYQLPDGVQEDVTLAYLNKILVNGGESDDPRAMKVALGAAAMIQKHPLVQGRRKMVEPNWGKIGEIGGDVPLDGLLAAPEEEEKNES